MTTQQTYPVRAVHQNWMTLIREATNSPKVTLKELESSTEETVVTVQAIIVSYTFHRAGPLPKSGQKKALARRKEYENTFRFAKKA